MCPCSPLFLSLPPRVLFFSSRLPIFALASLVSLFLLAFRSTHLWPYVSLNWHATQGNWLLKELKDMSRPSSPARETVGERNRRQRVSATDCSHVHSSSPTPEGGAAATAAGGCGGDAGGGVDGPAGGGAGRTSKRFRGGRECRLPDDKAHPSELVPSCLLHSGLAFCSPLAVFGLRERGQHIVTRFLWVQVSTHAIGSHTLNVKLSCLDYYHSLVPVSSVCNALS